MTAQRYQEQKDATEKMVANAMNAYDVLRDSQKENTKVTKDELEYARELVQKVLKAIGSDVQVDSAYINKLFNDSFFFEEEKQKATQTKLKQLFDKLTKEAKESGDTSGAVWLQEFEKQINGLNLNPLQNSIKKFLLGINGNADIQANWNIRSGETEAEFKKRIKTEIDTRNEIIRKSQSTIYPEYGQDTNKVKSELEELNRLYNELGGDKNKSRSSAERDIWAERISVLKEMQSRYEKLNQLMGENRAIEETRSAFKGALDFTQMGEVIKAEDIIPTKQGMIDALEKLLKQIPNDVKNAAKRTGLEKEIAELKIGIQQDYLKEQLDKTKQNIEDMFNGLDLHQKLKDAGLSEAEVQQLFPGLAKTLDDVEKGIEEEFNKLRDVNGQLGKDEQKDYEDRIAKLNQQRVKEQQDTIERLIKSYKTQFSEQLQLDEQYYKDLSEIRDKFQNAPDLQKRLEENATKMYNKKSANNAWKEFTSSDSYLNLFDNIEYYSTAALQSMKDKLVKMREELKDLSPTELKQIMEQEEKLDKQLNQRDPWNKLTKSLKEYTKLRKENAKNEKDEAKARDLQAKYEKQLRTQSKIVAEKKAAYESATENIDAALEEYEVEQNNYDLLVDKKKKQDEIVAGYDAANRALSQQAQKLQGIIQSLGKIDMGGGMVESISGITNSVSDFAHMLEDSFGVAIGEDLYEILDGVGALFDSLESFDITKPISSSLNVLTGLGKTIGSIFGIGNKNKKKEVWRLKKRLIIRVDALYLYRIISL